MTLLHVVKHAAIVAHNGSRTKACWCLVFLNGLGRGSTELLAALAPRLTPLSRIIAELSLLQSFDSNYLFFPVGRTQGYMRFISDAIYINLFF